MIIVGFSVLKNIIVSVEILVFRFSYVEVQDFEFTIEKGRLYCLQTRNGKMNASAFIKTSIDMVNEGLISEKEAILRIEPDMLAQLLHPRLDPKAKVKQLARGLPASPDPDFSSASRYTGG